MRINITAKYPTDEIRSLVKWAYKFVFDKTNYRPKLRVNVKNCSQAFAGRAYCSESLVVLRIGKSNMFPYDFQYPNRKNAPKHHFNKWQEALLSLAIHEFWHIYQHLTNSGFSEIEAENRSVIGLEAFKTLTLQKETLECPQKI